MAEHLAHHEPSRGEAFNISMEARRTVLELVDSVLSALDRRDLKPIIMNQASNEIRAQALSSDKARRVLGWTPKFTFDQAIARTIAWYQDYFNARNENQKPTAQLAASLSA
jgi:CDP-glucose 4,6-dehydratase